MINLQDDFGALNFAHLCCWLLSYGKQVIHQMGRIFVHTIFGIYFKIWVIMPWVCQSDAKAALA